MLTDIELEQLEKSERDVIDEELAAMLLILANCRDDTLRELTYFYQKYGTDGRITYAEARKWVSEQDHTRRFTALLLAISASMTAAFTGFNEHFRSFLTEIIKQESDAFNVDLPLDAILETKWGMDDSVWNDRLKVHREKWVNIIGRDVKQAVLRQSRIDDIVDIIKRRFVTMEHVLERLGYTEGTAIGSMARRRIFKDLGVTKYQFFTRDDERTCEVCGEMHNRIFPISAYEVGVTASPLHPNCRCWEVPIID
jgi:SPP1 gp7 family putative phage head morphogenesis protein